MEKIKEWVSKEGGVWTLKKMVFGLKEEEGIEVTPQGIWYRLKEEGWSWKSLRPYNPKGNEEEKESFKKGASFSGRRRQEGHL